MLTLERKQFASVILPRLRVMGESTKPSQKLIIKCGGEGHLTLPTSCSLAFLNLIVRNCSNLTLMMIIKVGEPGPEP